MAKIKYKAVFPEGTVLTRSSHRTYTHAWAWWGIRKDGSNTASSGFSRSALHANKAMTTEINNFGRAGGTVTRSHITEVEIV